MASEREWALGYARQAEADFATYQRLARDTLKRAKHLAQEIDVLAPAVKRGGNRPDNCEYPWTDAAGVLHVPLDRMSRSTGTSDPSRRVPLRLIAGQSRCTSRWGKSLLGHP